MYVYNNTSTHGIHPYTLETARESFDRLTTDKVKEVSKARLWAVRIISDIMSIITQPVVLISVSAVLLIGSIFIPPLSLAVAITALVVSSVAGATLGFAIFAKQRGSLDELSQHYAARANLAKEELNSRLI
jgi:hypothetical protein